MVHMEIREKYRSLLFLVIFFSFFGTLFAQQNETQNKTTSELSSTGNLEDIIWPVESAGIIPKVHASQSTRSTEKLKLLVLQNFDFPELVNAVRDLQTDETIATGFCVDVFRAAIQALQYQVDYELVPFSTKQGTYNDIIDQIYLQNYDGAVGDITITANRSLYVDFTSPFTDLGVGIIARKEGKNMWIFLKPLTADLWLSSAGFFILIGFVIWLIERPINDEFQGPVSKQIGMIFWFSFSTLVFAHKEKLSSNLSKFVVIVWVFVVLILTSSYTATLTSMITVQHIRLNSKENYYIGYQSGAFMKEVINNLNFFDSDLRPFSTPKDYAKALSIESKNGGVSAIIDEIPYLKIFLARYPSDYSMISTMSTTNGFAFVFRKGSPLVPDISRAIEKLREDGKLTMMENIWFKSRSKFAFEDNTSNDVKPLTLDSFRGLFLISGISSALALTILYSFLLHKNRHILKNYNFDNLIRERLKFIREYVYTRIFSIASSETNVIHPV